MPEPILTVEGLTLKAQDKTILQDASFAIPSTGLTALMGPVGTGKSTLLKWLSVKADPDIYSAECDRAEFFRAPLSRRNRPVLYGQKQGQSVDEMMAAFSVQLAGNPAMFCVDEATAERTEDDTARIMERLSTLARSRAIVVVTHNQKHARSYADHVMLIAGGRVEEITPAGEFFRNARSEAGRQFVGSGWVTTARVDTPTHHLSPELRAATLEVAIADAGAEGRLRQVVAEQIFVLATAGTPNTHDIESLKSAGVATLVTTAALDAQTRAAVMAGGLELLTLDPQQMDGGAQDLARCTAVEGQLARGPVAFLQQGDTPGGVLAAALQLVFLGLPAMNAAEAAGELLGTFVMAPEQEQVLWDFELQRDLEAEGLEAWG